jgi:hypothetical protein
MADIFISYSSEDKTIVKLIAGLLEQKGWSVWWDRQIPVGQKFDDVIENELHKASCVLVIWTKRSVSSEWVKNEASEAAKMKKLVPVILEDISLPLAFKRIESAIMIGWNGEEDHPELSLLYVSIENIILKKNTAIPSDNNPGEIRQPMSPTGSRKSIMIYGIIAGAGLILSLLLFYYYQRTMQSNVDEEASQRMFYLILIMFGISASALVFGVMNSYAVLKGEKQGVKFKIIGPAVGVILIVLGGFYLPPSKAKEKTVTIRLFDWKKKPITQGKVKIYLSEYIRTQSVDDMGQALFTGIPLGMTKSKMKIEVSSPGYATKSFDTLLTSSKALELTLPYVAEVFISGRVQTAANIPIKDVEINVDGTKYYAMSINDGTYKLRLEEYTLGDEITLITSHEKFEDKKISLRINSPEIEKFDIYLNPAVSKTNH